MKILTIDENLSRNASFHSRLPVYYQLRIIEKVIEKFAIKRSAPVFKVGAGTLMARRNLRKKGAAE